MDSVIAVYKGNIFAAGNLNSVISRRRYALVLFVQSLYPAVFPRIFITNFRAFIGGTVINQNTLKAGEGLGKDTVKALFEGFFRVIDRNYNR
jgi:hypothetical protein